MTAPEPSGWVPSNTHPPNTRIVASNVDTLHLSYFGRLEPRVAAELASKRAAIVAAMESRVGGAAMHAPEAAMVVHGAPFSLHPFMTHGYRYRLVNADLTLLVNPEPRGPIGCVRAQFSAALLWREGWIRAVQMVENLVRSMLLDGVFTRPHAIGRIDLCADFQGWRPVESDRDRFVTRANYRAAHHVGSRFSGLTFGKGSIAARLYDKTLEIIQSDKGWMRAVWEAGGYDAAEPVWRLEFQLRRDALRELGAGSLPEGDDGFGRVWRYLRARWLRLSVPASGERRERWRIDPAWAVLAEADFGAAVGESVRLRTGSMDRERSERALLGSLLSLATVLKCQSLDDTMVHAHRSLARRLLDRGETFESLVSTRSLHKATLLSSV